MALANSIIPFSERLEQHGIKRQRLGLQTLQINTGKLCNLACRHCHVESGPGKKRENMDEKTAVRIIELLAASPGITTVDITGGAPEMNPCFRYLVQAARGLGRAVIDRCNLTILLFPEQATTAAFLAEQRVQIVASLPCYSRENVEKQRGDGVFADSIAALRLLNSLGYGQPGSGLILDLVYNPGGAFLPPAQAPLKTKYQAQLREDFGILFNDLYTITNMPIKRFLFDLKRSGKLDEYMHLLADHFNPAAARAVMCFNLLSVSWDGRVYDCDFNQALGMGAGGHAKTVWDMTSFAEFADAEVAVGNHCYGCTAGAGSSCGGALV